MHTELHSSFQRTEIGREAKAILKSCVHCGLCTASCPTYRELGDERDGPRGRIYLIKQFLETGSATTRTLKHLDRCLTCRSCETACPSGVEYGRLLDLGRAVVEQSVPRPFAERATRWGLRLILPYRRRFSLLTKVGQWLRPVLPRAIKSAVPARQTLSLAPASDHPRRMLMLAGCVQPVLAPRTNQAAARVLDRLGIRLMALPRAGCCGALSYHLSSHDEALRFVRRNIDAWWPEIERGAEAIVVTASGCGVMVKDYGKLLAADPAYASKARRVSELAKDLTEILSMEDIEKLDLDMDTLKTAVHNPCTLQHGSRLPDRIDRLLKVAGVNLVDTVERDLCCGSAGTYSILQPSLSKVLLDNKLSALSVEQPDRIVTANVGCQVHLSSKSSVPVLHWIELLERGLPENAPDRCGK